MHFDLRKVTIYATCSISDGGTTIDLGMIDNKEAKVFLNEFKDAVERLEWFIQSTENNA